MRFMVLVPGDAKSEKGVTPENAARDKAMFEAMGKFNNEMLKAGIMLAADGLHPTSKGSRVKFAGGKHKVIDGPFTEAKEIIAGYWLIEVPSLADAIAWMRRAPFEDGVELEIRPLYEAADFA